MSTTTQKKMNVVLVISDQHNAGLMGCAGHGQVQTPNLDRFASDAVRFTHAYTQNTICTPSRVSILSGQYCHNHGIYGLSGPAPMGLNNLFRHFRAHGYRTAGYGKLHLPNSPRNWVADDVDRFGDTYETPDGVIGESDYFRYLEDLGLREKEDSWHNPWNYGRGSISHDARPSDMPYEHTQEAWCARQAMEFIDEQPNQPFFVKLSFQKPHHPLLPVERFWNLYPDDLALPATCHQEPGHRPNAFRKQWHAYHNRSWDYTDLGATWEDGARRQWRGTLACISQVDDVFGQLLDFLDERGLAKNTIVVYGADHGAYHGIHGICEKAPGISSEAVCRVPMIWRVPGITHGGTVNSRFIENIDIAPTLTALCGLTPMDSVDGLDASSLLASDNAELHPVAVTENAYTKALRWGRWRFVHHQPDVNPDGEDVGELYDLDEDPDETRNLYHNAEHQDTVHACRRLLLEWLIRTTRVTTTHPAVTIGGDDGACRRGDSTSLSYPLAGDGTAPNTVQPRFRQDLAENYI